MSAQVSFASESRKKYAWGALVLLGVGTLVRLLAMARLSPELIDPSYTDAARNILNHHFGALGDRTPLYPLFLAVCHNNFRAVWVMQSGLGLVSSLMLFDLGWRYTRRVFLALIVALACSLIRDNLIWESYIATEALATFLFITAVWLFARAETAGESGLWYPLATGTVLALGGLNRPLMLCLIPLFYCFVVPVLPVTGLASRRGIARTLYFAAPVVVLVLGWCGFNYVNSGFFSPTTRAGQQLMDQTTSYVQLAPDQFADIREVWMRNREHPHDVQEELFEESVPEIEKRTGKSRIEVSRELTRLAIYLELHHPLLCLRQAEDGWMQFWGEASPAETKWPQETRASLTGFAAPLVEFLLREMVAVFLLLSLLSLPLAFFRPKRFTRFEYLVLLSALWTSVFAAFTEFGDNHRFLLPFLPLVMYVVLTWGWKRVTAIAANSTSAAD